MKNSFVPVEQAAELIRKGMVAVIAGSEQALASLPNGRWIGGTTPYFMTEAGGRTALDRVFCTVIETQRDARSVVLEPDALSTLAQDRYPHGFDYVMLPAFSQAHRRYAMDAVCYPHIFNQPVMGWVTGVPLTSINTQKPKVFDGFAGQSYDNAAVVLHVQLPDDIEAEIGTVNLFTQGGGANIVFPETGFSASTCLIDDKPTNFAHWLIDQGIDTHLPLVTDYLGMKVNVAVQQIDRAKGRVDFYAPVLGYETYRIAQPIADYANAYRAGLAGPAEAGGALSCNCILNYLYAGLEGKTTHGYVGPVTFGEIAHILLNQTLVRLHLRPKGR